MDILSCKSFIAYPENNDTESNNESDGITQYGDHDGRQFFKASFHILIHFFHCCLFLCLKSSQHNFREEHADLLFDLFTPFDLIPNPFIKIITQRCVDIAHHHKPNCNFYLPCKKINERKIEYYNNYSVNDRFYNRPLK